MRSSEDYFAQNTSGATWQRPTNRRAPTNLATRWRALCPARRLSTSSGLQMTKCQSQLAQTLRGRKLGRDLQMVLQRRSLPRQRRLLEQRPARDLRQRPDLLPAPAAAKAAAAIVAVRAAATAVLRVPQAIQNEAEAVSSCARPSKKSQTELQVCFKLPRLHSVLFHLGA